MFTTILAATDGSDHARKAVRLAAELAALCRAKLVIVLAVPAGEPSAELRRMAEVEGLVEPDAAADPNRVTRAIVEHILDDAAAVAREQLGEAATTRLATGDPVRVILDAIEEEKADLVVMGTRGLSELKGLLLGSVSHKVAQLAPCPCLTVK
jgi:nucleotide-binding universal stress UspA family protein